MKYQQRDLIDDLTCILKKEIYICRLTGAIEMIRSGDRKSSRLIEGRRPAVPRHWEVSNTFWLAHQRKFTRVTQSSQSHNRNTVLDSQTYTKFDFKLKRHGGAPNTTLKRQTIVATGASLLCDGVPEFIVCSPFWSLIGGGDDGGQMVVTKVTDKYRTVPSLIHSCLVRWCICLIKKNAKKTICFLPNFYFNYWINNIITSIILTIIFRI